MKRVLDEVKAYRLSKLLEWQEESGHKCTTIARMLGVPRSHLSRIKNHKSEKFLSEEKFILMQKIRKLEHLIAGNPADVLLLKHELKELIGR